MLDRKFRSFERMLLRGRSVNDCKQEKSTEAFKREAVGLLENSDKKPLMDRESGIHMVKRIMVRKTCSLTRHVALNLIFQSLYSGRRLVTLSCGKTKS